MFPEAALLDTSVLLRFFHNHHDAEQGAADRLRDHWMRGKTMLLTLDLAIYEFVNILVRRLGRGGRAAAKDVSLLFDLEFPLVSVDAELAQQAALIAAETGISGYDAAFVAGARSAGIVLITADRRLARAVDAQDEILLLQSL